MLLNQAFPETITAEEALLLQQLLGAGEEYRPRARIVRVGIPPGRSLYLLSGMVGRYSCDRAGRRQFVGLQIPGDYFDLAAYVLGHLDHDVDALGTAVLAPTSYAAIDRLRADRPELHRKLWRISLIDASVHRYWIFRTGRLAGKARMANFLAEMHVRLYARGLCDARSYVLPLSQNDLAEICGMTSVHVNRLLRDLRLDGICTISDGVVQVADPHALARVGQFGPSFLYLEEPARGRVEALLSPGREARP